jgi:hypothetical protein
MQAWSYKHLQLSLFQFSTVFSFQARNQLAANSLLYCAQGSNRHISSRICSQRQMTEKGACPLYN